MLKRATWAAVALIAGLQGAATAQPLADQIPADAVFYVGWRGTDSLGQTYQASKLKAVLDSTKMAENLTALMPEITEMMAENDESAQKIFDTLDDIGPI